MKKNIIKFIPESKSVELSGLSPVSSIKTIPQWYKDAEQYCHGEKKLKFPSNAGMPNVTYKKCIPFLDALTSGYMAVLDDDIYVELVESPQGKIEPYIRWRQNGDQMISWHDPEQYPNLVIPEEYHQHVIKWHNNWIINTPEGYSTYFTHPSNRFDLPFHTISGVVDTDTYEMATQFPFLLKKNFEGIIPSGTPVAQLILFKREPWSSERLKHDPELIYKANRKFYRTFIASYKKNYWHRKSYE